MNELRISIVLLTAGVLAACLSSPVPRAAPPPVVAAPPLRILEAKSGVFLPDFSFAGYRQGAAPLPDGPVTHRAADFGAVPNDGQDDTLALKRALESLRGQPGPVVLGLAAGRYELQDALYIERSDFVLRGAGAGADGTVLAFEKPLADLPRDPVIRDIEDYLIKNDKRVDGKPFSPFSWTGGLIWTRVPAPPPVVRLSDRIVAGQRGERWLEVGSLAQPLAHGQLVELCWYNRFGAESPVLAEIFQKDGPIVGARLTEPSEPLTCQLLTVDKVEAQKLWLLEPLRHGVKADWGAELRTAPLRLHDVGIERLSVELPNEPYAGHHLERGANAFYLTGLRDSFVRDVAVKDSDSAILSDDCERVTLSGVSVVGRHGHYGIHLGDVDAVLVRDFDILASREHSLSFNTGSRGSVFSRGHIDNPRLDQHRGRNYQNLFDAIVGVETDGKASLFEHGGADYWGPTHGAFNTFWNIALDYQGVKPAAPLVLAGVDDAGPARLVGVRANVPLRIDYPRAYQEATGVMPSVPSLYDYQLAKRTQK